MTERLKGTILFDYILITIGTLIMAFGLMFFLEPNTIAPGGVTGLAIVIQKISGIPIDITNLVINIPLFIIGLMVLGKKFGLKTAYGTLTLSLFIRLIITILGEDIVGVEDLLLSALYGGVLMGVGIGLVFKGGGTTGGTDLAGAILNKYIPNLSIPKLMMVIDLMIVATAGIVNKKLETALYSVIALYIIVKIADFIIEGLNYAKAFFIISNYPKEIGEEIMRTLDRGVTVLQGRGMYTGNDKDVLLCIVDRSQVAKLKNIVHAIDENAFIMVTTVHEVLGEGFKEKNT
ncbi:YitT family protein [Crassaminicella thermophila]|uniref:YitT family protein n=1 Tax=Crassaminicella thermophila TaxID=2599308 RepID=A0A5C0SA25_CRATE|nr:YitT family protein [Crassaminicella thermophila]QEK11455.1 YitT family protein [Crassaminicella thermophila]